MSGYWIAGLSVIALLALGVLLLRVAAARGDAVRARRDRDTEALLQSTQMSEIDTQPDRLPDESTEPAYLSAPEVEPPKWASDGPRRR